MANQSKTSGDKKRPRTFELPQLHLVELTQKENKTLNHSIAEMVESIILTKQGKPVSDQLETPVLSMKELEPFRKVGLSKDDMVEMQTFIDDEVKKFVDRSRMAVVPALVGRIVVKIVAGQVAKKICKKINC